MKKCGSGLNPVGLAMAVGHDADPGRWGWIAD
jgi:hypothetical protein